MGNCLKLLGLKKLERPVTLLLVGLDNAGKTTAAKGIVGDSIENVAPTVGFSPETIEYRGCTVRIYDLGGGPRIRAVWPKYFSEIHGVIFVIDSSDKARVEECHSVLEELLSHKKVSGKPVLVLANKQDVEGALDEIDIVETLKIEQIVNNYKCPARVETCSAISLHKKKPDKPIADGFRWLIDTIVVHYKKIHKRVEEDMAEEKERLKEEMERRKERIRLIREERERKEREAEEQLIKLQKRRDSDDEEVIIQKQTSEQLDSSEDRLTTILNKIEDEDEAILAVLTSGLTPIDTDEKIEESPLSSSDTKELQELGFKSPTSLHSSTSSTSSDFNSNNDAVTSPSARRGSLSTHLIEVHPSPSQEAEKPALAVEGCYSEKMTAILLEDSPLRSSECVPIDSDDELFSSVKEDETVEEEMSPQSYVANGSAIAGVKEQIELEASLMRRPRKKTFLKRLHRTAPMVPSSAVSNDFLPPEGIMVGTEGRIP